MQYKTFMLPVSGSEQTEENLNVFLRTHRIVSVRTEFVTDEQLSLIVKQKPENHGKLTAIQAFYHHRSKAAFNQCISFPRPGNASRNYECPGTGF